MDNRHLVDNLKRKNAKSSSSSHKSKHGGSNDIIEKFNPDVEEKMSNRKNNRKKTQKEYVYTNIMFKPIIGAVTKEHIQEEDLIVAKVKKITENDEEYKIITSNYATSLEKRMKESQMAKQMAEEYAKEHNIKANVIMDEIEKPFDVDDEDIAKIENIFEELKKNSSYAVNSNSIDYDKAAYEATISNFDDLIDKINNL